jgi:DNA-binding transcriptional ArsR family regulator
MAQKSHALTLDEAAGLFGLLGDPKRLRIALLLAQAGELHGRELRARLGLSPWGGDHHLGLLRTAGVVESRRDGKRHFYRLSAHVAADLLRFVLGRGEPERQG